jgi:ELWxxDGT repeat protein
MPELCGDGKDNNCDGEIDGTTSGGDECCFDLDGDGFDGQNFPHCTGPVDCDDSDPNINASIPEDCGDGIDNNCDGEIDGDFAPDNCCLDTDGDGICDYLDICPGHDDNLDTDGGGTPDGCDACPSDNPNDTDGDGICDSSDICNGYDDNIDSDGDGTPDGCDECQDDPFKINPGICGCGVADVDSDSDGIVDCNEGLAYIVKDILPGITGSIPQYLTNVNGTLFFSGDNYDLIAGRELWKSNGTDAGTVLVKDIRTGTDANGNPLSSNSMDFTNVNGTLFFTADDGSSGRELWKSDGTDAGTVLVKDIRTGTDGNGNPLSSNPAYLTNVNGTLFFRANDGSSGVELWKSDGTDAGTVLVKDIVTGTNGSGTPLGSAPYYLTNVNGTLFFTAYDSSSGVELWKSDGTDAGTVLVKDIRTGTDAYGNPLGSSLAYFTDVNGTLFFRADDGSSGRELWKSDGTDAGTVMVKDIRTGTHANGDPRGSSPVFLTNVNGTLFFRALDDSVGAELWKSDGTDAGTVIVKELRKGTDGSGNPLSTAPDHLTNVNGILFFEAEDNTTLSRDLWKTDGTDAGTVPVLEAGTGLRVLPSGNPFLTDVNGMLFLSAIKEEYYDRHGIELWAVKGHCLDSDNDGYGTGGDLSGCYGSTTDVDCNDSDAGINPGAAEACNNIDDNCNGSIDDNLVIITTCGLGECAGNTGAETCTAGVWSTTPCDPLAGATTETCNNLDDNCDGTIDEGFDADSDGTPDCSDSCPNDALDDADGDGVCGDVDACEGYDDSIDPDGDGTPTGCDTCPLDADDDIDGDLICGDVDNCPNVANADQTDSDAPAAVTWTGEYDAVTATGLLPQGVTPPWTKNIPLASGTPLVNLTIEAVEPYQC